MLDRFYIYIYLLATELELESRGSGLKHGLLVLEGEKNKGTLKRWGSR